MIKTPDLINALVADAHAVRRLRSPAVRTGLWLLVPAAVFVMLALAHGVRPDLGQRLVQAEFVVGLAAPLLTGVLAAFASFMLNLPDRSRAWILLPMPSLLTWIFALGHQCLTNWVALGPEGIQLGESARCFATVLVTSLPLSLALFAMLRHGALLGARSLSLMASLAVAAMTAAAMSLFHRLDASVMVLIWNLGVAAVIVALCGWIAPRSVLAR